MTQEMPYFKSSKPRILAHRGLVDEFGRENTLAAFAAAKHAGAQYLETDVRTTKDGIPVLFHDASLTRVAGIKKQIKKLTSSQVKKIDIGFGNRIPTLEEALLRFPSLNFNIDIKVATAAKPVAEVINRLGAFDRVLIASFSDKRRLATTSLLDKPVATSAGWCTVLSLYLAHLRLKAVSPKTLQAKAAQALQLPLRKGLIRFDTDRFISRMHSLNLEVHFWTVNDVQVAKTLIERGADGFVTDAPDKLAILRKN